MKTVGTYEGNRDNYCLLIVRCVCVCVCVCVYGLNMVHSVARKTCVFTRVSTNIRAISIVMLDDQSRQYWIYANTDNELATVHIKVDCE